MSDRLERGRAIPQTSYPLGSETTFEVRMPEASLTALVDLLSHTTRQEFREKLHTFTDMDEQEIAEAQYWLHTFWRYLQEQGIRPRKVKRGTLRVARKWLGTSLREGYFRQN